MDNINLTIDQYTKMKYESDFKRVNKEIQNIEKFIKSADSNLDKKKKQLEELNKELQVLEKIKKYIV